MCYLTQCLSLQGTRNRHVAPEIGTQLRPARSSPLSARQSAATPRLLRGVGTSIACPGLLRKPSPTGAIQPPAVSRHPSESRTRAGFAFRQIAFVPNAGQAMLVPTGHMESVRSRQNRYAAAGIGGQEACPREAGAAQRIGGVERPGVDVLLPGC